MRINLRNKIQFTVGATVLAILLFEFFYFPFQQSLALQNSFASEVHSLSEALTLGVTVGLQNNDMQGVQKAIEFVKRDPRVRFVAIVSDGQTLAAYPETFTFSEALMKTDSLAIDRVKLSTDNIKGEVIVACSKSSIETHVRNTVVVGIVVSLLIFVIGLLAAFWLARSVARPVIALRDAARRVSAGDLQTSLNAVSRTRDEIGDLTEAFEIMVSSLLVARMDIEGKREALMVALSEAEASKSRAEDQQQYLQRSVQSILNDIQFFAEGDLTVRLASERDDEIAELCKGFNTALEQVNTMVLSVITAVDETVSASEQIMHSAESVASGAELQAREFRQMQHSISGMNTTISGNADNTAKAARVARENRDIAETGGTTVTQMVEKIREIARLVAQSASVMQRLGESSAQIGEIISVINEIADQTNLLALNAAIEAARAGDAGRGFAVVADEVRKLAERTQKATKEISTMVTGIQNETKQAVRVMNIGNEQVQAGIALAEKAGTQLHNVVRSSEIVLSTMNDIATATDAQSATSTHIYTSIQSVAGIAETAVAGIMQIGKASENLQGLMQRLSGLLDEFETSAVRQIPQGQMPPKRLLPQ
ncbi:MAG: HAMP domain-containing protein [Ignavibacteria bacterium]|nr:HAMP domain-containing protein [Ignavibacteria bacterium]